MYEKNVVDLRKPYAAGQKLWISPHSVVDLRNSIVDLRKSVVDLRKSVVDLRNSVVDLRKSVVDLRNFIADLRKLNPAAAATASRNRCVSMPSKRLATAIKMAPMASKV
jgi:hypothetical protein